MISEFCWTAETGRIRKDYERIFGKEFVPRPKTFVDLDKDLTELENLTCELFDTFMIPHLLKAAEAVNLREKETLNSEHFYEKWDCHFLPQWDYLQHSEWIIEQSSIGSGVDKLASLYNKAFIPNQFRNATQNGSSKQCTLLASKCINNTIASLIETIDHEVFDRFGYSHDFSHLV